jgi:glycosyltransferase involved in cell wall biosynthesis
MPNDPMVSQGQIPLVTVITVVRNAAAVLPGAIESVLAQDHPAIEYLIIDGASSDGTLDVIRGNAHRLAGWISEPDQGISDAFNKGIARAKGEIIGLLNADDRYTPGAITRAVAALRTNAQAGWAFGHMIEDRGGPGEWTNFGDPAYHQRIRRWNPDLNHPTVFMRRSVYEKIGGFDTRYRYAMDYDLLLRAELAGFPGVLVPEIQVHFGLGGVSDRNWHRALGEVRRISVDHGRPAWRASSQLLGRLAKGFIRRALVRCGVETMVMRRRLASQRSKISPKT